MVDVRNMIHVLYKKLLTLYPRGFRDRLGESMEQTFTDLYREQQTMPGLFGLISWTFSETAMGIIKEHLLIIRQGYFMKSILTNHNSAAITSLILSLPMGLIFVAFMFDMEQLTKPLTAILTTNGYDLNSPGRIFLMSGLLLLPVAFVLNLRTMLKSEAPEGKRRLYTINLVVCILILLLILFTWGGLFLEEIYCLQGIRCD